MLAHNMYIAVYHVTDANGSQLQYTPLMQGLGTVVTNMQCPAFPRSWGECILPAKCSMQGYRARGPKRSVLPVQAIEVAS